MASPFKAINWKIMIPVMLFAVFNSAFNSFSSVLADISARFPEAPATTIQMIITFPSVMGIPVSLLAGILASYITKKRLVIFALCSQFIGGMLPFFSHDSIYTLFISCGFIGIGQGFLISCSSAILAENFEGTTRGTAMGLQQVAGSLGIMGLTIITGRLSTIAWYKAYYVYLLTLLIITLTLVFLPRGKTDDKLIGKGVGASGFKAIFNPNSVYFFILFFFLAACQFAFYTNIGMSVTTKGLGNASAIGVATAWNPLATVTIGFLYGFILRIFKKYTLMTAMIAMSIAFIILTVAPSLSIIAFGGIIFGVGSGLQQATSLYYVTEAAPATASALTISIALMMISLGVTLSPVVINGITRIAGREVNGTSGLAVAAAGYGIFFLIELVRERFFNRDSRIGVEN
ncbi:MAG: MFS transporter [Treponema sp.]|jgi:MFS family permease|nr:MFS transporter [Treponema sp.]